LLPADIIIVKKPAKTRVVLSALREMAIINHSAAAGTESRKREAHREPGPDCPQIRTNTAQQINKIK